MKVEAILIAIIVILILYVAYKSYKNEGLVDAPAILVADPAAPVAVQPVATGLGAVENAALQEQASYHSMVGENCENSNDCQQFNDTNMDYREFVASKTLDSKTVDNHNEFVKDRMDKYGNWTGRTMAMPDWEEPDQIKWIGIRGRPQGVPVRNPDQVPDINYDWYSKKLNCV